MVSINVPLLSVACVRNVVQLLGVVLGAIWLGACAQSSVVTRKSELVGNTRQGSLEHDRRPSSATNKLVAITKQPTPFRPDRKAAEKRVASDGLASFYGRNADRERRSVRYVPTDCGSSYVAIRHQVARDKRRHWPVRDSSGQ